jgi:uroporphyrinogen-III synthase
MQPLTIISTKKLDPALVDRAGVQGFNIQTAEQIDIRPVHDEDTERKITSWLRQPVALAFTSQHAAFQIRRLADETTVRGRRIYCLAGATSKALHATFGEAAIAATARNAQELAAAIIANGLTEIVFFCGNRRRDELPLMLSKAGINVHELIVYQTIDHPVKVPSGYAGVLFFSPSAVNSFFAANQPGGQVVCFAIGDTTASELRATTKNIVIVSPEPDPERLLLLAQEYFTNAKKQA